MTLPPRLEQEINELRSSQTIEVIEDPDFVNLLFVGFALGVGYNKTQSDLLLRVPRSYPEAGPDMFWVDQGVTLANGTIPQAADSVETYCGRLWRRFSWHRQTQWNPTFDNIHGQVEFIRRRLKEQK